MVLNGHNPYSNTLSAYQPPPDIDPPRLRLVVYAIPVDVTARRQSEMLVYDLISLKDRYQDDICTVNIFSTLTYAIDLVYSQSSCLRASNLP